MKKIDKYIEEEKAIMPSTYLEGRIMARIKSLEAEQVHSRKAMLWQSLAVAGSVAIVVMTGVILGSSYKQYSPDYIGLMVNDSHFEQLSTYIADEE